MPPWKGDLHNDLNTQMTYLAAHAAGLELEDGHRLGPLEDRIGRRVVHRQTREVGALAGLLPDEPHGLLEHRQGAQAEEVHLQQPDLLDRLHVPLRRHRLVALPIERHVVEQRPRGDEHAGGVRRGVPRDALEHERVLEQPRVGLAALRQVLEIRRQLERPLQRHPEPVGHQTRHPVHVREGDPQRPAHVAHHALRAHGPEGDDLRDVRLAVLLLHVLDDLAAPEVVEVDVDIGHRHALGVQEALEDEPVRQRVDVGDVQRVGDQRARHRAAPGPHADAVAAREGDEVAHDQEVGGEAHPADDVELVFEALAHLLRDLAHPRLELGPGDPAQAVLGAGLSRRQRERRQQRPTEGHLQVAALRHRDRVLQRVGEVREGLLHLLGASEVQILDGPHPLRVVHRLPGLDAEQDFLRLGVVALEVVIVVGRHQRDPGPRGERPHALADLVLDVDPVVHDLEEVVLRAEHLAVAQRRARRALVVVREQVGGHLALGAGREREQPLCVLRQELVVHAGLVVEALEEGERGEPHQVAKAGLVARQQDQVVHPRLARALRALAARDVGLHADDGLDPGLARRLVELDRPEHGAVVGEGERRHAHARRLLDHRVDRRGAVEQRVVAVIVQVDEVDELHCAPCLRVMRGARITREALRDLI